MLNTIFEVARCGEKGEVGYGFGFEMDAERDRKPEFVGSVREWCHKLRSKTETRRAAN